MDIFISYASSDKAIANALQSSLSEKGITSWFDETSIQVGDDISSSISNALDSASIIVFILSKESYKASWVSTELAMALSKNKKIVPLLTANDVDIPPLLSSYKGMLLRSKSDIEAVSQELATLLSKPDRKVDLEAQASIIGAKRKALDLNRELYVSLEQARFKEIKARSFSAIFISMCTAAVTVLYLFGLDFMALDHGSLIFGVFLGAIAVEAGHYFRKRLVENIEVATTVDVAKRFEGVKHE